MDRPCDIPDLTTLAAALCMSTTMRGHRLVGLHSSSFTFRVVARLPRSIFTFHTMPVYVLGLSVISKTFHCMYKIAVHCSGCTSLPGFVVAKAHLASAMPQEMTLLEVSQFLVFPGEPSSDLYEHYLPDYPVSFVVGLGLKVSPCYRAMFPRIMLETAAKPLSFSKYGRLYSRGCCVPASRA
ncbi:hypothetical protein BKA82DRAFT_1007531 [Pisolithus tinctorius]|uniref:Uncharacterized protein n=1 Tax=Pisolithus tinctorius Marx 270 TaxID=870435 RepID=A0A0C3JCL8_PISTI|nr:hypothetical protein BKA82DRAFT_1007531 [Pisolithus tinctorius]KIN95396.1 hypothetical protein M404DRAFT_1007531 [Pisolithus tinctorius Marx 270]